MPTTSPHDRFRKSMVLDLDAWRDGTGYDLDAFRQMSEAEQDAVVAELSRKQPLDWRDQEVLAAHGTSESIDKLRDVLVDGTPDERAHALGELIKAGKASGSVPDVQLAHILDAARADDERITYALILADEHAGPMSKLALLQGARDAPRVALHYAAKLIDLAGLSDGNTAAFDRRYRAKLLRLRPDNAPADRAAAFREVCGVLGIDADTIPDRDASNQRAWAERTWPRA